MKQNKMSLLPDVVVQMFDDYVHGQINRRDFLKSASAVMATTASAALLLEGLFPNYAQAQTYETDASLQIQTQKFPSLDGHIEGSGYLVRPADGKITGSVLVVHENRGLNPYIKDVCRRFAKAGFLAFAPDALHSVGGYPGNDDDGRTLQQQLKPEAIVADFKAAARYLASLPESKGEIAVVGFCFGGAIANLLAVELPELIAVAVPFYGRAAPLEKVPAMRAHLLLHFAEQDPRVNEQWPAYEQALLKHKKKYQAKHYAGASHGFHNDTTPRYLKAAADEAWQATIKWLNDYYRT